MNQERDPMYPDTGAQDGVNNATADQAPPQGTPPEGAQTETRPPTGIAPSGGISGDLSRRLGGEGEEKTSEVLTPKTPIPFDFNSLTLEQRQTVKEMLAATPDRTKKKLGKPTIRLRQINGKIVEDFKTAQQQVTKDRESGKEVERHFIPIKFFGEEEYMSILYKDFINSEQVLCEVVEQKKEIEELVVGETISRTTGQLVEMVRRITHSNFTVKLPDGKIVEVSGNVVNA